MGFGIASTYSGAATFPVPLIAIALAVLVSFQAVNRRRGSTSVLAVVAAGFLLGQAAARIEVWNTGTTILSGETTTRLVGRVRSREVDERGRQRYVLDVLSTERPTLSRPPERVRILVSSRHRPLPIGSLYRGLVRLRPPAGPAHPGGHDFSFAPFFDGLGAYGFALGSPEETNAGDLDFEDRIATLRLAMGERIRGVLTGPAGAVASALITGERAGVPQDIENDLRATSLAHILSISGFHMALVAGFCMVAVRSLLACFPRIALRWPIRKIAALSALAATTFYMLLSGDNAATERSFIMILLMLGAVLIDRPSLTLRNVALAALIVMARSPHVVLTPTFQMSFAATAALVGAFGAYTRWRSERDRARGAAERSFARSVLLALTAAALSSLIAGMATAPYGVYQFQRIAPFGLIANVVATPIFSFWVMPLALIAALLMPLGLERLPLLAMGQGLELSFAVARHLASWLPDQPTGRISGTSLVCFTLAVLTLSFMASRLRWLCLPLTVGGLLLLQPGPEPQAVLFEDGRQLALLSMDGRLTSLSDRPNRFVTEQWLRVYSRVADTEKAFICSDGVCRARSSSGVRISWTDDWRRWPAVCTDADVAIVARAIRQSTCPNGAILATLRTPRPSGSLGIYRLGDQVVVQPSVDAERQPWNVHRKAPWPEFWRRDTKPNAEPVQSSDSVGSAQPAGPAP
ncbi:ComEC/Rec2 family competence protein [Aureimonas sp. AU4]|uniref:ComEC/Rec2 family competence protein n=1 Tax=Aureimonas sp. AU4 TaxID=1638163 RepID=UPI0009EB5AC2|nr:ComEC/Rec2 family competence protein [Aureimonas sp. AU4]